MEVKTFPLGELQTNCSLLIDQNTNQCIIIDPADEANFISEQILQLKVHPIAMIATHGHFDHLLAAGELQMAFDLPFYLHQKDFFLLKDLQKNASFWLKRKIIEQPPKSISFFPNTPHFSLPVEKFKATNFEFTLIPTPGHTPGSVCLYLPKLKILFTGDTLFAQGVGRTDFSYSSAKDLRQSLQKLKKLPPKPLSYPVMGPPAFFQKLSEFNFFRR